MMKRLCFYLLIPVIFLSQVSCGVLFIHPKNMTKDRLNALFSGWLIAGFRNSSNQISLDKSLTFLREGEEVNLSVSLTGYSGDGIIYFKSDNPTVLFNGAQIGKLQFSKENFSGPQ
ncbi:MAG TPA: hypothetical protein PKK94_24290, partial [Leptospiraceae bacterium]|nr:hypothetical protein [Leptospiraceae bacterium]